MRAYTRMLSISLFNSHVTHGGSAGQEKDKELCEKFKMPGYFGSSDQLGASVIRVCVLGVCVLYVCIVCVQKRVSVCFCVRKSATDRGR